VLVNTARGPLVDETALASALREGEIFAAELDVVDREPEAETAPLGPENIRAGITVVPCQTIGAVPPGRHEY
jgi:phosphoglycerate dehydrogenase-like enzyme